MYSFYPSKGILIDKMKIARALDKTEHYCWANLALWAIAGKVPRSEVCMMPKKGTSGCEQEEKTHSCMCGKFHIPGFFDQTSDSMDEDEFPF